MPQFVRHGPIVPDKLVQDLEDDRVVIFCGAGISMGAGLPDYRGLVEHCYAELGRAAPRARDREWDWPDRMLGFLESRVTAARLREVVAERLDRPPSNLEIHRAILRLARLRRFEGMRLITTNFDTFFEQADGNLGLGRDYHAGPILPIPRNDRAASWRSLVYLHGRLGQGANHDLVLTSADFGRAYLTEAWAARFVARLFSEFTVLFIGYSLNDPVLRYMTDAFAAESAEKRAGELRGPAYIFIPYTGRRLPDRQPYLDRNLEPIFYHGMRRHLRLKRTLMAWADAREDYLANTASMIRRIAPFRPYAIDPTDTANLLWAVAGRPGDNGHGARAFAEVGLAAGIADRPPPIEWFDVFEGRDRELQSRHQAAVAEAQNAERQPPPAPDLDISLLFPRADDRTQRNLTPLGHRLIPWLVRHLGNTELVRRVIAKLEQGRRPHAVLRLAIRRRLGEQHMLLPGFERFWRIVSSEGDWTALSPDMHPARVVTSGVAPNGNFVGLRQELMAALRPTLQLQQSLYGRWREGRGVEADEIQIGAELREIADAEVRFADEEHVVGMIGAIDQHAGADAFWAGLVDELTSLLIETLALYEVAGEAGPATDPSAIQRPSIVPHAQNHNHEGWTRLFDLIWRGWTTVDAASAELSRSYVARWRRAPYLAFRRLAAAAMEHSEHFSDQERLEVLADA